MSGSYTQFIYGPLGDKLASANGQTLVNAFVGLPGGAQAVYNTSGIAYYRHSDWLGSARLASTPSRTLYSSSAFAPFGERYAASGTTDISFTGQQRDTATSLYDFPARRLSQSQGRWISPDPARLAAVDPTNPQSWNRYAYVTNNPCNSLDPFGFSDCSFNIAINNTNLLTPSELSNAQNEISRILGLADLGVNFTNTGVDFTVNLTNNSTSLLGSVLAGVDWDTLGQNDAWFGGPTNSATVWVNNVEMAAAGMDMGTALGRTMTHEFGHWGLNIVHTYPTPGPLESGIMSQGLDPTLMTGMATLTPNQILLLRSKCQQKHPKPSPPQGSGAGSGGGGGSGAGGGVGNNNSFYFLYLIFGDQGSGYATHEIVY